MRRILFRGQDEDGHWHIGYYFRATGQSITDSDIDRDYIGSRVNTCCEIKSETVSQFTGLKDMNGAGIWEGDIVRAYCCGLDDEDGPGVVTWDDDGARFTVEFDGVTIDFDNCNGYDLEIVGNRWDNPELLEERSVTEE